MRSTTWRSLTQDIHRLLNSFCGQIELRNPFCRTAYCAAVFVSGFEAACSGDRRMNGAMHPMVLTVSFLRSSFDLLPSIGLVSCRASNRRVRACCVCLHCYAGPGGACVGRKQR